MLTKILFFDVDGPMISGRANFLLPNLLTRSQWGWEFDPCAVGMLNFLGWAIPSLRVVIASHRVGVSTPILNTPTTTKKFWEGIFQRNNLNLKLHHDWITVREEEKRVKRAEIRDWLKNHPEVTHYATIDDEINGIDDPTDHDRDNYHLVAENYDDGITFADLRRLAEFFELKDVYSLFIEYRKHLIAEYSKPKILQSA